MKLSVSQDRIIKQIQHWLVSTEQTFILAGYAGTGKTTIIQKFINDQHAPVTCCAPTGKAASVLQKKLTNAKVYTIHRLLYTPNLESTDHLDALRAQMVLHPDNTALQQAFEEEKARLAARELTFNLKQNHAIVPNQLVVVDEASMVTQRMWQDLHLTGAKLLFVGDPGQLPPVKDISIFEQQTPDAILTDVHRQALGNPIIAISMKIRNGASIPFCSESDAFRKMPRKQFEHDEILTFDQVITDTNESRRRINRFCRKKRGYTGWWPNEKERLICLRNCREGDILYINGMQASVVADFTAEFIEDCIVGTILYENAVDSDQIFYPYPFLAHYDFYKDPNTGKDVVRCEEQPWQARDHLKEFDYAYAITVHKAQGSEWDKVLLVDNGKFIEAGGNFQKRWLYTAVTRAKKELVWVV